MTSPLPGGQRRRPLPVVVLALLALLAGFAGLTQTGCDSSHDQAAESTTQAKYTCGMHPWIITNEPGDCPICGMKLTLIEDTAAAAPASGEHAGHGGTATPAADDFFADLKDPAAAQPGGPVDGRVTVKVGPEALRAAGVQTAPAALERLNRTVRTVGQVIADETRIRHVHTKVDGWVEALHVNFRGQMVEAGQPILSIYSPTLLASQEEFLRAKETATKFSTNADEGLRRLGKQLADSARRRLELFDVPASFIDRLEKEGKAQRAVTLNAPTSGFVTAKAIFEGQQIEPGLELYTVTDLSRVWIEADFYEYEASQVAAGQEATVALPYDAAAKLAGTVAYIYPFLTPESRTLKVRFEFANLDYFLKPGMYADVAIALETVEGLTVPESAVMDTGLRRLIFVEIAPGTFEPREVALGVRGSGKIQIVSGLKAGEAVVTRANFLIDSESRLRASTQRMSSGGHDHGAAK